VQNFENMKILLIQETNWIERGPHQQHHLMDRMSLRGHEIRVIDYDLLWRDKKNRPIIKKREYFGNQPKVFPEAKVELIRPAVIQLHIADYLSIVVTHKMEIKKQIEEFKPNVILSFGIMNAYIGARLAKKHGIPHIYYLIDHLHTLLPFKPGRFLAKYLESKTLKISDRVFVINRGLADYAEEMGADKEKISIIPGGVDLERYQQAIIKREEVRKKYGVKDDEILLFFMGWLYEFSGLKEVAQELVKSKSKNNIKLIIVGEGDIFEKLKKIKGNSDRIILTGKQSFESIPELLSAADICLLPAYDIPIMKNIVPIKMYEYMAAGKPVIATSLPGIMKEFGKDNGVIYVDRPEDVLEKAVELIENGGIEKEGRKARKFVEKYGWDNITDEFEGVLEEVVRGVDRI